MIENPPTTATRTATQAAEAITVFIWRETLRFLRITSERRMFAMISSASSSGGSTRLSETVFDSMEKASYIAAHSLQLSRCSITAARSRLVRSLSSIRLISS